MLGKVKQSLFSLFYFSLRRFSSSVPFEARSYLPTRLRSAAAVVVAVAAVVVAVVVADAAVVVVAPVVAAAARYLIYFYNFPC